KPDRDCERQRIEAAGGHVNHGRVDGLSLSRAIGDWDHKSDRQLSFQQQKVIATPEMYEHQLQPDEVIVVCCDGLVESMTNEQLSAFVTQQLQQQRAAI